jgi:hypothetical protein
MNMLPVLALALTLGAEPFRFAQDEAELSEEIRVEELRAHVYRLASPEFLGRSGAGAARAAGHIAAAFKTLKLKPAFGDSYFQPIPWPQTDRRSKPDGFVGKNVAAVLPGADPVLKDEWILLSCHLDHLGMRKGQLYPGADDNASGCAMLLEVAERFALQKARPARTIVFVAFDQEETNLLGSTHFAAHPPLELKCLRAFLTADMIGRSMGGVMDEYVFVLGSECSAELRQLVQNTPPSEGLKVGRVSIDMIGTRSDYGPFRERKVPFLFFSTGQHFDYHTPRDTPDKIDYAKLRRISNWIFDLTAAIASAGKPPAWVQDGLAPDMDEVRTIHILLERMLARHDLFAMNDAQTRLVKATSEKLQAIIDRGEYTASERSTLILTARLLMTSVF